jgi:tetratricopeptide (TPR) repeat protein
MARSPAYHAIWTIAGIVCLPVLLAGCATGSLPDVDVTTNRSADDPFAELSSATEATADDAAPFLPETWPEARRRFVAGAEAHLNFADVDAAMETYREARRRDIVVFGEDNWRVVEVTAQIALVQSILDLAAEEDRRMALDAIRGRRHAIDLSLSGQYALANEAFEKARDDWAAVLSDEDVCYASLTQGLAKIEKLRELGDQSERHYQEALAVRRQHFGDVHPRVADAQDGLGMLYLDVYDDPATAQAWLEKAVALRRQTQGLESTWYARSLTHLARAHIAQDDPAAAVELLDEAIAIYGSRPTDEQLSLFLPTMHLGRAQAQLGELQRADELLRDARRTAVEHLPRLNPYVAECLDAHQAVLAQSGHPQLAEALGARADHIRSEMARRQIHQPAAATADRDPPPLVRGQHSAAAL